MQIVDDCPNSEEKWKQAVLKKNCEAHASQCSEPEKLEYHCVINPFINQTLEVCAYAQYIVLGLCTEYSMSGNIIQGSVNADCQHFKKNQCPIIYRSTEAYEYPSCYDLTKKASLDTADQESTITSPNVKYISLSPNDEFSGSMDRILNILVAILTLSTLILGFLIFAFCGRVRNKVVLQHANKKDEIKLI